jgi:DNA-binding protein WhiA
VPARRPGGTFTERLLAELAADPPTLTCCRRALIEGMRLADPGRQVVTTRLVAARSALMALHAEGVAASVEPLATPRRRRYRVRAALPDPSVDRPVTVCCATARLRGLILAAGSLSRPDRPAHLELSVAGQDAAGAAVADLASIGIAATRAARRGRLLVQVRSASSLATLLSRLGAQRARLEVEAARVVAEVRSGVSRRLNAETANLRRTVRAAVIQLEAIDRLRDDRRTWGALPPALREAAALRRRLPRADLDSLAAAAGCSRPAMADRLRRLLAAARVGDE